jgi:hypothetical protein
VWHPLLYKACFEGYRPHKNYQVNRVTFGLEIDNFIAPYEWFLEIFVGLIPGRDYYFYCPDGFIGRVR